MRLTLARKWTLTFLRLESWKISFKQASSNAALAHFILIITLCGKRCFNHMGPYGNLMLSVLFIWHTNVVIHISCKKNCLSDYEEKHPYKHFLFSSTDSWSIGAVSYTLLLNLSATSKEGHQLLLIVSNISLHDVHARAQQSLEGLNVHD